MAPIIRYIESNGRRFKYVHFESTQTGGLHDEEETLLLCFSEFPDSTIVSTAEGRAGNLRIENINGADHWVYYERPLQTRVIYGTNKVEAQIGVAMRFANRLLREELVSA